MHLTKYSISVFAGVLLFLALCVAPALADRRVALVIGNSSYENVPKLPNPSADANAIAEMFKSAGFEVVDLKIDVGHLDYKRAIRRFEDTAVDADIAVVFFAGHGIEIRGTNYMIPIDAKLADERDAPDEAIPLDRIIEAMSGAKRLRLVIIDACRDNPFSVTMKRHDAQRSTSRGLMRVEPQGTDTLIAFAARAGSTAEDGHGAHSPLTTALLNYLTSPGLDIRLAFGRVRDEVMKITSNRQEPFVYGSLGGDFISLVPAPSEPVAPAPSAVKADYELVEKVGTKKAWDVFLATYHTGFYAELAKAQLAKIIAAEQAEKKVATLESPPLSAAPSEPSSDEQRAWEKIKDSSDEAAFVAFIKRFPNSALALIAQRRLETLEQLAKEQEEKARAEREAALQRAEDERRAKVAEAARQKAAEQEAEDRRWMSSETSPNASLRNSLRRSKQKRKTGAQRRPRLSGKRGRNWPPKQQRGGLPNSGRKKSGAQRRPRLSGKRRRNWPPNNELRTNAGQWRQRPNASEWRNCSPNSGLKRNERRRRPLRQKRQKAEQLAAQRAEEQRKAKAEPRPSGKRRSSLSRRRAEEDRKAKAAAEAERQKAEQLAAQRPLKSNARPRQ